MGVAKEQNNKGADDFSTALYATFVEHTLNRIIHLACVSKKTDVKTQSEIIKNINISGKCTWLIKLLNLPPFNTSHIKTIESISAERNSYIHYKWKPSKDEISNHDREKIKINEKLKKIKSLLKYLRTYEAKIEFKGKKTKIVKLV